MQETDDSALLQQYAESHSEEAFAALVTRHVNLVYSVALRHVGNPHNAEEITQAVFVILAKKAAALHHARALSSWLFQATRLTATNFVRSETRRLRREEEAHVQSILNESGNEVWPRIAPVLDAAVAALREKDREAIVLRFYEGRNLREVGLALGSSEDAAEKRVSRALEKLRTFFAKRGVVSTAAIIAGAMAAHSVQAAPAALATAATAAAIGKGAAVGGSTLILIQGALKVMAWTKTQTTVVAGVSLLLLVGTTTVGIKTYEAYQAGFYSWRHPDPDWQTIVQTKPQVTILPTKYTYPVYGLAMAGEGRWVGIRATVTDLMRTAYRWPAGRIYFPAGEPTKRYDFASTLPHGTEAALQKKIETKLGLVGRHETRDTDVFILKVRRPGALAPHQTESGVWDRRDAVKGRIQCMGEQLSSTPPAWPSGLTKYLELFLKVPVIDETGLTEEYDIDLNWKEDPQDPNHEAMKSALIDQLGLELVPGRKSIELLVVEKVK